MRPRPLSELARAAGGTLVGDDALVSSVEVHSERVLPGSLFVALPGSRVDGHMFVGEAFARGASGAMVERAEGVPGPAVLVPSTAAALLALAAAERRALTAKVMGITGSVGKTSTKDMAAAVIGSRMRTHASPASFNNQVGLPLTILGAPPDVEALVCEIGAGVMGEIAALCRVARPEIGVVTSVGVAHLGTFGSRAAIARAKAELVEALPPNGVAILNADDPVVLGFARRTQAAVLTFGRSSRADVRAEDLMIDEMARARFVLRANGGRERLRLAVPGEHMVTNALAAAACGFALGIPPAACAAALERAAVSPWRMELVQADGLLILNDAYNASPSSVAAALGAAAHMAAGGRCIAVLGPMAELGPIAERAHRDVGSTAARLGVDAVVTVGREAFGIARGALDAGMPPDRVVAVEDLDGAHEAVLGVARAGDVVLVKGSRAAGLDRLAHLLVRGPKGKGPAPGPAPS